MILSLHDVTYGDTGTAEKTYTLNSESSVYIPSDYDDYSYYYFIPFSTIGNNINGNKYKFWLTYTDENQETQTIVYDVDFTFSSSTQQNINDNNIQDTNDKINDINNFLNNDNIDEDNIINNFPQFTINHSSENLLEDLFNMLYQAFISNESTDFVFYIPNSNNQSITFRADYIETHLPITIVTLIRVFYWYIISMYILKDVWHYIDRLRQGDLFLTNDKDIKTEVL